MAIKAKTKSPVRVNKKLSPVSVSKAQSLSTRLNSPVMLKNKKIIAGVGVIVVIVLIALLAFLFKSVFIAAMVNGEPISRLSVVSALEKQGGKATLANLITKKLILQETKKRNVAITQSDIDAEIKRITATLQAQGSTLEQAMAAQGLTKADLDEEVRIQIAINKMVGTDVTLTDTEVNDFVAANKAQMTAGTTDAQFRQLATQQLKQQKLQTKTQEFIKSIQDKAKIIHFVSY